MKKAKQAPCTHKLKARYQRFSYAAKQMKADPAVTLSCFYFIGSLLSLYYVSNLLEHFSVRAISYLDLTDYLTVLVYDQLLLVKMLVSVGVYLLCNKVIYYYLVDRERKQNRVWLKDSLIKLFTRFDLVKYSLFIVLIVNIYFAETGSNDKAQAIKDGSNAQYLVSLSSPIKLDGKSQLVMNDVQIVFKNERLLFLYQRDTDKTWIVPRENIAGLQMK